jgi:hypothetical protein
MTGFSGFGCLWKAATLKIKRSGVFEEAGAALLVG